MRGYFYWVVKAMALTEKRERFVKNLLKGMTDRQAYLDAFPSSRKWKVESVDVRACLLKKNSKVKERLDEARERIERRTEITAEKVREQLGNIALFDIAELYDDNGQLKPLKQLPKSITTCITAVDTWVDKDGNVHYTYKFNSKDKSLALLSQITGLLEPKKEEPQPIVVKVDYGD